MTFTPGPWRIEKFGTLRTIVAGDSELCEMCPVVPNRDDNARLIAAAPDMLAALIKASNDDASDIRFDTFNAIRAAIAKATDNAK